MFALRNPAPRKPNDRRVIDSEEVKQFKKYLQEDYNIRAVDVVNTNLFYSILLNYYFYHHLLRILFNNILCNRMEIHLFTMLVFKLIKNVFMHYWIVVQNIMHLIMYNYYNEHFFLIISTIF